LTALQIKTKDIPAVKEHLMREQNYTCPLCGVNLMALPARSRCLDHDHRKTTENAGGIRGVLCSNCNGMEGKIHNCSVRAARGMPREQWVRNLIAYWDKHKENVSGFIHPQHGKPIKRRKRK